MIINVKPSLNKSVDDRLDRPDNINSFRFIVYFSMTLIALGWFGCIYVFHRVYEQWKLSKKGLAMIYKLPFYTACIDFLTDCNFFINILHTAVYAQVWGDTPCKIIGALNWAFLTIDIIFYAVIAVMTYLRICHEIYFYYGKYDYKLWLIVLAGSMIIQLMNLENNGKREYLCAGRSGQIISAIILFSTIMIALVILLFCYISILRRVRNSMTTLSSCNHSEISPVSIQHAEIERRATKKILSYMAMFLLQWIPMSISQGARIAKKDDLWVYVMGALGRSFGGVGNAIQYIINEGIVTNTNDNDDTLLLESLQSKA